MECSELEKLKNEYTTISDYHHNHYVMFPLSSIVNIIILIVFKISVAITRLIIIFQMSFLQLISQGLLSLPSPGIGGQAEAFHYEVRAAGRRREAREDTVRQTAAG